MTAAGSGTKWGPPTAPPVQAGPLFLPPRRSGWVTAVGIIAIILGALEALGGCSGAASPLIFDFMSRRMPPGQVNVFGFAEQWANWIVANSIMTLALAVVLLCSGIGLLKRRRWAVKTSRLWAFLKIPLVLAGAVLSYHVQQANFANMSQVGGAAGPPAGVFSLIGTASVVLSIAWGWALPAFLLVWFARQNIKSEIAAWT